jgi:hypothetical protein
MEAKMVSENLCEGDRTLGEILEAASETCGFSGAHAFVSAVARWLEARIGDVEELCPATCSCERALEYLADAREDLKTALQWRRDGRRRRASVRQDDAAVALANAFEKLLEGGLELARGGGTKQLLALQAAGGRKPPAWDDDGDDDDDDLYEEIEDGGEDEKGSEHGEDEDD